MGFLCCLLSKEFKMKLGRAAFSPLSVALLVACASTTIRSAWYDTTCSIARVEASLYDSQTRRLFSAATKDTVNPSTVAREPRFADLIIGQLRARGGDRRNQVTAVRSAFGVAQGCNAARIRV